MGLMKVKLKFFGGLKPPSGMVPDENGIYHMEFEKGLTVLDLINNFSLTGKPLIIVINGIICNDYTEKIKDGDVVSFFPPVAGG